MLANPHSKLMIFRFLSFSKFFGLIQTSTYVPVNSDRNAGGKVDYPLTVTAEIPMPCLDFGPSAIDISSHGPSRVPKSLNLGNEFSPESL
jgi:hypothetical protein